MAQQRDSGLQPRLEMEGVRDDEKQSDHVAAPFRVTYVPTAQDAGKEGSEGLPATEHGWTLHTSLEHEQEGARSCGPAQTAIPSGGGDHVALDHACAPAVLTSGSRVSRALHSQAHYRGICESRRNVPPGYPALPCPHCGPPYEPFFSIRHVVLWPSVHTTPLWWTLGLWTYLFPISELQPPHLEIQLI